MEAEALSEPDWRDGAAYAPLLDADRSLVAWEWLRRDPHYRAAAVAALASGGKKRRADAPARPFGLVAFEDPRLAVPVARPLWHRGIHPLVLSAARVGESCGKDAFDLARLGELVTLVADGEEHLLLSDGLRAIRLDGPAPIFTGGPVRLRYRIEGLTSVTPKLLTLQRFIALCRTGAFARSLHRREARARRWILALRAWDALAAGAGQRQIAELLLGPAAGAPRWRLHEPSLRLQAQRLVRSARAMASGDYRRLLGGGRATRQFPCR